jgi:hypothetical protein
VNDCRWAFEVFGNGQSAPFHGCAAPQKGIELRMTLCSNESLEKHHQSTPIPMRRPRGHHDNGQVAAR